MFKSIKSIDTKIKLLGNFDHPLISKFYFIAEPYLNKNLFTQPIFGLFLCRLLQLKFKKYVFL